MATRPTSSAAQSQAKTAQPTRPQDRLARLRLPVGIALAIAAVALGALGLTLMNRSPNNANASMAEQATLKPAPIDGERAYGYLKQICDLGPRPAGSAANTRQRELVAAHFKKMGADVKEQPFTGRDPQTRAEVKMANLIGSWFPDRNERVVIGVHYDTRPYPDRDPDPARQRAPFIGANDGASGVALLMEMAHHLKDAPTPWGVDLVLFDGEELVYGANASIDLYFLGSKAFSKAYREDRRRGKIKYKYVAGFVLDMVGDRDLKIEQEQYSLDLAPRLVRDVWAVAQRLEAKSFIPRAGQAVYDDHLAMNDGGIPTIDLIDFDYPQWHTADDLPQFCSAASLAEVGRVVTAWLNLPKPRERRKN